MAKASLLLSFIFSVLNVVAQNHNGSFRLYLIGDAGQLSVNHASYKKTIQDQLKNDSIPSAIVFLGDNIYPKGMPQDESQGRGLAEQILEAQIDLVKGVNGDIIFVPGNHDWKKGGIKGLDYVLNQQGWIDSLKNEKIKLLPGDGCPGPEEVSLNENLVLVVIDTQWWLHPWDKPTGESSLCECKTEVEVIVQLDDILRRNQGKQIVVVGHHPIVTYGEHGGEFSLKEHIFPFTSLNHNLYIPLPIVGSIYPLYRKIFGDIQDTAHPQYKKFRQAVTTVLEQYPGVIYASGHDHSLQYNLKNKVNYVVSGAGSKSSFVKKKEYSQFASSEAGYVRVTLNDSGEGELEYIVTDTLGFKKSIAPTQRPKYDSSIVALIEKGNVKMHASDQYTAGRSKQKWLGENYRAEWKQDIEVPVLDLKKEGLEILQRGGGRQTLSLRLRDSTGHEYSMRSIEKYPEKALPNQLLNTFAEDIVQDQISAAHPYAALVVPYLADAAGIYHTNPKVVYVPNDPMLGAYQKDFGNRLMIFEERADGKGDDLAFFGKPDKMISSTKLLKQVEKDNDNQVDQKFFLRSRLFDMWIGDWDRHEDQWRWAEFDSKKGKTFRPIPRDRDQAFFVNEGRIPKFVGKRWLLFQFEGLRDEIRWPSGLMFSGRYIDRKFLTTLSREDWLAVANELKENLTDSVIDSALKKWPSEIYALHGETISKKLKSRRNNLSGDALEHYLFLSKVVSLAGSDKKEVFDVERHENGNVTVSMYKLNKESERGKVIYQRDFIQDETKEIRLYGLGGADQFYVHGPKGKMKVRIIGGKGNDVVLTGLDKGVFLYDKQNGVMLSDTTKIHNRTSVSESVNEYNWRDFKYNRTAPLVYLNYNVDDGVFLGGGFISIRQGFRKDPFKSQHLVLGSYAINTSSFNFKYDGKFTSVIGRWDLELVADVKAPNYVNNFFGWGNESVFDKEIDKQPGINVNRAIDYYRVRFHDIRLETKLSTKVGKWGFVKAGPQFQRVEVEHDDKDDRFVNQYTLLLDKATYYGGVTTSWGIDKRNHPRLTTRGVFFEQSSRIMKGFSVPDFSSHYASLAFYQSFKFPAVVTFAARAGAGWNFGTYEFYQAQILDGKTEIRGFRKTRFYGDKKFFVNNEVRIKLASLHSYLFPAYVGVLGFYDVGRVWYKDGSGIDPTTSSGKSSVWHKGFGGGIWFTPFNMAVVSAEVGHSNEGTLAYLRLGFLF